MIKSVFHDVREYLRLKKFQDEWLKYRGNNNTKAGTIFPKEIVTVGDYTYGTLNVHYYKQPDEMLTIGSFCSIADNVHFFTGGGHDYSHISTFPFKNHFAENRVRESVSKGRIVVEDDVWIGNSCIILSGVRIGRGAVIGAGSIVAKDVPSYAVYCAGEVKKYRFSDEVIDKLMKYDFSMLKPEWINKKIESLYTTITENNVDKIIGELSDINES